MTQEQIQIEIQSIINGLAQLQVMSTYTESTNFPDYLDEIADEVRILSNHLKDNLKYVDSIKKSDTKF